MKITYDPEVDASSIIFQDTTVTTRELGEGIAAEFDASGHLAGIEVLDVAKRTGDRDTLHKLILLATQEAFQQVILERNTANAPA